VSEGEGVILLILAYWTVALAVGLVGMRQDGRRALVRGSDGDARRPVPEATAAISGAITFDPSCLAAYALGPPIAVILAWLLL